jgi:AraC-like DNA-binding protein
VLHARLVDYAYPPHCHDTWTVLIIDHGAISYDLDMRHFGAAGLMVTVLPPGVVHDGQSAPGTEGFRKRTLYLDADFLPTSLVGAAVDHPTIDDDQLRWAIARLHDSLASGEEILDGEGRLASIGDRLRAHLSRTGQHDSPHEAGVAYRLRELLDAHTVEAISLQEAAGLLDRSVPHLVRSFTGQFGVSPHAYVTGRRVDDARRRLLRGDRPADVAASVGFYDQAHLTRHFKRHTSVTPAEYAASHS